MYIRKVLVGSDVPEAWPFTLPPVRQLRREGLVFSAPITFLVGENGSGKSTLIEALASACRISTQGGKAGTKYASAGRDLLGDVLELELTRDGHRMLSGPRLKRNAFFLRAETLYGLAENVSGRFGFWEEDLAAQSHGEGFMTVLGAKFRDPGMYFMDEPESALSFLSCLHLIALIHDLAEAGSQVICATHSPVLTATPGAAIIELDGYGFHPATWDRLAVVDHMRRFLARPDKYLGPLLADNAED